MSADPGQLPFDVASDVVGVLLKHADDVERRAVELDRYQTPKAGYGAKTVAWAGERHAEALTRARLIRAFARDLMLNAKLDEVA